MASSQRHRIRRDALASSAPSRAPDSRKRRILLVDDDEMLAQMGREMLECLGYEVVVCGRSLDAIALVRRAPHGFDLVLTDYDMPALRGDELARKVWHIRPDMPIILCTGGGRLTCENAHLLGFDAFLSKPFRLHDLAAALERTLYPRATQ